MLGLILYAAVLTIVLIIIAVFGVATAIFLIAALRALKDAHASTGAQNIVELLDDDSPPKASGESTQ